MTEHEIVFGRHSVLAAIKASHSINKIFFAKGIYGHEIEEIKSCAKKARVPYVWVDRKKMQLLSGGGHHQGVLAFIAPRVYTDLEGVLSHPQNPKVLCILDHIVDPRNLGAIIRSAAAFKINGILLTSRRSSPLTASAMKTSEGAAEHIPIVRISNVVNTLHKLKSAGFWSVGADPKGDVPIREFRFPLPLVLVLGNEEEGLRPLIKRHCDYLVRISISSELNSLNVSLASGIFFYEIYKQRNLTT